MKRCIFKLCLFLLLSAIINVAVAWGFALQSRNGGSWELRQHRSDTITVSALTALGQRSELTSDVVLDPVPTLTMQLLDSRGCPLLSMSSEQILKRSTVDTNGQWSTNNELRTRLGIDIGPADDLLLPGGSRRVIPLLPIWPGFAINTIFYAAIMWMLFAFPGAVRRRTRAHRGRCTACGYDLRGRVSPADSNICPECGVITVAKPSN